MSYCLNIARIIFGSGTVQQPAPVQVALTDAQIKALPTTPITLVAAPGSGKRIKLLSPPTIFLDTLNGGYTNINAVYAALGLYFGASGSAAALPIQNDNTMVGPAMTGVTTLLNTVSKQIVELSIPLLEGRDAGAVSGQRGYIQNYTDENQAGMTFGAQGDNAAMVVLIDNNGSGNLTGGNALNSMRVTVYYAIETY